MKIAVIGSGISGLICGYLLGKSNDLTIFEADSKPGGHVNTVEVQGSSDRQRVDTGFIVFNKENYPNFCRLLDVLEIESQTTRMGFSVSCERTGFEYSGESLRGFFGSVSNLASPRHWNMLREILKFHDLGQDPSACKESVEEFVATHGFGKRFIEYFLYPLGSALWSCPKEKFESFPMEFVLHFMKNHKMLQVGKRPVWRVIKGGSDNYVNKIVAQLGSRLRLNAKVASVERLDEGVQVDLKNGESSHFDEVVLACHADQSLRLLKDAEEEESQVLNSFPYESNLVTLHSDQSLLPKRKSAWASWNARIPKDESSKATSTYSMNILQGLQDGTQFCVSLNQEDLIADESRCGDYHFSHPTYDANRAEAQRKHPAFIRRKGISLCGAYWGYGFHEDGLSSGLKVCESFGESLA